MFICVYIYIYIYIVPTALSFSAGPCAASPGKVDSPFSPSVSAGARTDTSAPSSSVASESAMEAGLSVGLSGAAAGPSG